MYSSYLRPFNFYSAVDVISDIHVKSLVFGPPQILEVRSNIRKGYYTEIHCTVVRVEGEVVVITIIDRRARYRKNYFKIVVHNQSVKWWFRRRSWISVFLTLPVLCSCDFFFLAFE